MRHGIKMLYMGEPIEPYNGFYCNVTEQFMRPTLGGGLARTVKCDDSLAIMEVIYAERRDNRDRQYSSNWELE